MIYKEVLNHLDVDELRNLVGHYCELDEKAGELNFANNELIECFQRLYNNQNYKRDKEIEYTCKQGKIRRIEELLCEKYRQYIPKPICGADENEECEIVNLGNGMFEKRYKAESEDQNG